MIKKRQLGKVFWLAGTFLMGILFAVDSRTGDLLSVDMVEKAIECMSVCLESTSSSLRNNSSLNGCLNENVLLEVSACLLAIKDKLEACVGQAPFLCDGVTLFIQKQIAPLFASIENTIEQLEQLLQSQSLSNCSFMATIDSGVAQNHDVTNLKIARLALNLDQQLNVLCAQIDRANNDARQQRRSQQKAVVHVKNEFTTQAVVDCLLLREEFLNKFFALSTQVDLFKRIVNAEISNLNDNYFAVSQEVLTELDNDFSALTKACDVRQCEFNLKLNRLLSDLSAYMAQEISLITTNMAIQTDRSCQTLSQLNRQRIWQNNILVKQLVDLRSIVYSSAEVVSNRVIDLSSFLKKQICDDGTSTLSLITNDLPLLITQLIDCRTSLYKAINKHALQLDQSITVKTNTAGEKLQKFDLNFTDFFNNQLSQLNNQIIGKVGALCEELVRLNDLLNAYKSSVNTKFSCVQSGIQKQLCEKLTIFGTNEQIDKNELLELLVNADLQIAGSFCKKVAAVSADLSRKNDEIELQIANSLLQLGGQLSTEFSTLNNAINQGGNALCVKLIGLKSVLESTLNNELSQLQTDLLHQSNITCQKIIDLGSAVGNGIHTGITTLITDLTVQDNSLCDKISNLLTDVTLQNNMVCTKISGMELAITSTLQDAMQVIKNRITELYVDVQLMTDALAAIVQEIIIMLFFGI